MNVAGLWSLGKRAVNMYPHFVLGTGSETCGKAIKTVVKNRKSLGLNYGQALRKGLNNGLHDVEKQSLALAKKEGGFFQATWKNIKTFPKKVAQGWRIGGAKAAKSGKNVLWGNIKGAFKGIGTRMPLIGSLLMLAYELPNIFKATTEEGVLTGAVETVKAGARLGGGALGAAIGSLIGPVGTLAGWIIGEHITSKIIGKSYTQKKEEQKAEIQEQIAQANGNNILPQGNIPLTGVTNPYAINPTLSPQQLQYLAMQLYGGNNNFNNDYMYNMSGLNQPPIKGLNTIG